ncbi:hypothetical protein KSF_029840 [Reticulibacter mediterranei]|uniref:Glycosyltransferase family 9 protein n=1 Tax=Reticulibacter mediterranei TaxID=2778369 RepID=A0A8J3IEM6_9CHLR|nr:glycosyltransferase family 9 protein [Reticulibacter mediterranei]GHO92936.1 hypothetical protein KSF_029840 [Reticulibacter mediterranei]
MTEETQQTFSMSFLHDLAQDKRRPLSASEQAILDSAAQAFRQADAISVRLGGKAGRLGESVVGTGLLEAILQAIIYAGKAGTPLSIVVDETARPLFNEQLYQEAFWPQITLSNHNSEEDAQLQAGQHLLVCDLHGAHDGMPSLHREKLANVEGNIITLSHLFRVGVRSYAQRGPQRRYADFVETLLGLPAGAIDGTLAQPRIRLGPEDEARYPVLAEQYQFEPDALHIICFFQSVVIAKCYWRWDEVMAQFCRYMAQHFSQQKISFLIACGPDELHPEGLRQADFSEEFGAFSGTNNNAMVRVGSPASLRDLAILAQHSSLALSDDTGPSHIAGAVQVPTITPFLPGNIYSHTIWSSTLWHRGVTLEPNPFSYQQIEAAILWNRTAIIDSIPPELLVAEAIKSLPPGLQTR